MKKLFNALLFIYAFVCFAPALFLPAAAENVSHSVPEMRLTDVLVSALYFIGVLLLIYCILTLVSRWGKKHPEENTEEEEKNAERKTEASAPEAQAEKAEKEEKEKNE